MNALSHPSDRTGAILTLTVSLISSAACAATVRNADRWVTYEIKNSVKPVGDVDGHVAGSFANRGLCMTHVGLKDEEVGVVTESGTFDAVFASPTMTTSCVVKGTATCTFSDGSSRTDEFAGTCRPGPTGLVLEGRAVFVAGTGRFVGIKGSKSWSSRQYTPGPENLEYVTIFDVEYTVPKD
jgi:hypothetical protein